MAIEKHFFTQSSTESNVTEVMAWLSENASEYFDSFDKIFGSDNDSSDTACFRMKTNNGSYVAVKVDASGARDVIKAKSAIVASGTSITAPYENASKLIAYAIKTTYGIALIGLSSKLRIFITKSNLGATSVYVMAQSYRDSTSAESMQFIAFDLVNSIAYQKTPSTHSSSETAARINEGYYQWQKNTVSDLTVLAPFVFRGGTYAEHMFITPFSQYPKTVCNINVNNTNYFYDGYVALEE